MSPAESIPGKNGLKVHPGADRVKVSDSDDKVTDLSYEPNCSLIRAAHVTCIESRNGVGS